MTINNTEIWNHLGCNNLLMLDVCTIFRNVSDTVKKYNKLVKQLRFKHELDELVNPLLDGFC